MPEFRTTNRAQMRRCRMAYLHGEPVDEAFDLETEVIIVSGYVRSVRPDLTSLPLKWFVTIEEEQATLARDDDPQDQPEDDTPEHAGEREDAPELA